MLCMDVAGFVLVIFSPDLFVFTILITGIYVRRANNEYDALTAEILKDVTK